jgi:hypothetical protein
MFRMQVVCRPNNWERTSDRFLLDWLRSHVDETGANVKKPLLEEFGKRLDNSEYTPEVIAKKRDHVFQTTYSEVWKNIEARTGIAGSLFWRWNLPMFDGEGQGNYGINPDDSTFAIIKKHARQINHKINSVPPRTECGYECWVPSRWLGLATCKLATGDCEAYWAATDSEKMQGEAQFFTSKAHCCQAGFGAYKKGCSWLLS